MNLAAPPDRILWRYFIHKELPERFVQRGQGRNEVLQFTVFALTDQRRDFRLLCRLLVSEDLMSHVAVVGFVKFAATSPRAFLSCGNRLRSVRERCGENPVAILVAVGCYPVSADQVRPSRTAESDCPVPTLEAG
jgi:hypothetical protein